jgi:hypothetical protein
LDRWWHLRQLGLKAGEIATQWRAAGITHVLINDVGRQAVEQAGFDPFTVPDWAELQTFRTQHLVLIKDLFGAYSLYELR